MKYHYNETCKCSYIQQSDTIPTKYGKGYPLKSFTPAFKYLENVGLMLQIMFLYVVIFLNWMLWQQSAFHKAWLSTSNIYFQQEICST